MTVADIYAAEVEACRLECLYEEAVNTANRLRIEYHAAIRRVRELVRAAGEKGGTVEGEGGERVRNLLDLIGEEK